MALNGPRAIEGKLSSRKREEDADVFLAQKIARNKQFSISKQADYEYDYDDDSPKRKGHRKQSNVLEHEPSTRSVDDNVWEELRNFKKCLIKMFDKQDKDVVFLETVMGLAKQQQHCLIECVPLPHDLEKEAPLYFKKAIDEAGDEWSHSAMPRSS